MALQIHCKYAVFNIFVCSETDKSKLEMNIESAFAKRII